MKVNVLFERAKDGYYSCFMEEELPDFGLAGYGDTAVSYTHLTLPTICSV